MKNYNRLALVLVLISFLTTTAVFLVIVLAIRGPSLFGEPAVSKECTAENSRIVAESFLKKSSTFKFDGIAGSIKLVEEKEMPDGHSRELIYTYRTRYSGHGDRSWQKLNQEMTGHTVTIEMKDCKVVSAVCDESWDMLTDKPLQPEKSP